MRKFILASSCVLLLLSGCVTDRPRVATAPAPVVTPKATTAGKSNRFVMTQNGRRMDADDFEAWMKARGIRIAKGPQAAKRQAKTPPKTTRQRR